MSAANMAYFYSHDGDKHGIRFGVEVCTLGTLAETVRKHLYPDGVPDDEAETLVGIMEALAEKGAYDFEDGWIAIRDGAAAIVEFMTEQLREAKAEENHAHEERAKEGARRATAETKYAALCEALIGAIDTKAPTIREVAANGGIAGR